VEEFHDVQSKTGLHVDGGRLVHDAAAFGLFGVGPVSEKVL
jgi:hypothetical protein